MSGSIVYNGEPLKEGTPLITKIGGKEIILVQGEGSLAVKKVKNGMDTDAKKTVLGMSKEIHDSFKEVNLGAYEVQSTQAIDEIAIRKICIDKLGMKMCATLVVLMNYWGFTGKANGNLTVKGNIPNIKGEVENKEINLYDVLKPIITTGKTDMKSDEVTPARMVRSFREFSRAYYASFKGKGPYHGLNPGTEYNWYYGGIYNCENLTQKCGHFFGMAYALKNKTVPKMLPLDFPSGYFRREIASETTLSMFIYLAHYMTEGDSDVKTFNENFIAAMTATPASLKEAVKLVKTSTVISYIMSLGDTWAGLLPAMLREKFNEQLLSDAFRNSGFNIDAIKKAKKQSKAAKEEMKKIIANANDIDIK